MLDGEHDMPILDLNTIDDLIAVEFTIQDYIEYKNKILFSDELDFETKKSEIQRLANQEEIVLSLQEDEELAPYPDGSTVRDVIASGLLRQKVKKPPPPPPPPEPDPAPQPEVVIIEGEINLLNNG